MLGASAREVAQLNATLVPTFALAARCMRTEEVPRRMRKKCCYDRVNTSTGTGNAKCCDCVFLLACGIASSSCGVRVTRVDAGCPTEAIRIAPSSIRCGRDVPLVVVLAALYPAVMPARASRERSARACHTCCTPSPAHSGLKRVNRPF